MISFEDGAYESVQGVWIPSGPRGEFTYSDGDEVEQRIFRIVSEAKDKSTYSDDLAKGISDWPTRYHLSTRRAGLIRPVLELIDGDVLEIGAGCGAITRFIGEAGRRVTALEGSFRRATIIAQRCSDLPNVDVVCDNIDALEARPAFDTILLIGVLEYARCFFKSSGPDACNALLAHAKALLKPGGRLIVAIENQFGLKYLAGYPEDHLGEPFFGIEDRYEPNGIVTFGRQDLRSRLYHAGLPEQEWWFPFPDYKLPISVVSETALTTDGFDTGTLASRSVIADAQRPPFTLFSLQQAWRVVERNGLTADLANSFLVVASMEPIPARPTIAYHLGAGRPLPFDKYIAFEVAGDGVRVLRRPALTNASDVVATGVDIHLVDEQYTVGELWHDRLLALVTRSGWTIADLVGWTRFWWDAVMEQVGGDASRRLAEMTIPGHMLDAIPRNMIVRDGRCIFIDQEWVVSTEIEASHLIYRALNDAFGAMEVCAEPGRGTPHAIDQIIVDVAFGLGLWLSRDDIRRVKDLEHQFQERAVGAQPRFATHDFGAGLLPIHTRLDEMGVLHDRLVRSLAEVTALQALVGERDGEVAALQVLVDERDGEVAALKALVGERDREVVAVQALVGERDREVAAVQALVGERDREVAALRAQLDEADRSHMIAAESARRELADLRAEHARSLATLRNDEARVIRKLRALQTQKYPMISKHRLRVVLQEIISELFLEAWYLERNQDVKHANRSAILHYISHGADEGRDPHPRWVRDM